MSDDKNNAGRIGRRRFLSLSAVGVSAWGLTGAVGAGSQREDQVPIAKSGDDVVATEAVPRAWLEHVEQARRARANVAERLQGAVLGAEGEEAGDAAAERGDSTTPSTTVGLEPAPDRRFGGRPGFRVRVREAIENRGRGRDRRSTARSSSSGAAVDAAPAEANGVPVRAEKTDGIVDFDCPNRGHFDPVPGGVAVYSDETSDGALGRGTATAEVRVKGSFETFLMSAAHVFSGDDCFVSYGEPVYLADDPNEKVGEIVDWSVLQDYVLVRDTEGVDWTNTIREETDSGADTVDVDGHLSELGVAYWLSEGNAVSKSGSSTGLTSGTLTEMYVTGDRCATYGGHAVSTDAPSATGDSGSPVYATIGGDAYVVSMLQQGQPVLERSNCGGFRSQEIWGTAAYRMHDVKGIVFDV